MTAARPGFWTTVRAVLAAAAIIFVVLALVWGIVIGIDALSASGAEQHTGTTVGGPSPLTP